MTIGSTHSCDPLRAVGGSYKGSFAGVKDQSPKFTEQRTLQRLRKEIPDHVFGRTVFYRYLFFFDPIGEGNSRNYVEQTGHDGHENSLAPLR